MAEINYSYKDSTHSINTYDELLKTYHWICDALHTIFKDRENMNINCSVAFSSDEMSYDCNSIDEFKKYAFGKNIEVKRLLLFVSEGWVGSLVDVFAAYRKDEACQEFVLSSKDEMLIINLREALLSNKKVELKQTKETVIMKIEDNSIHIGDNNHISNSVVGSKNKTKSEQKADNSKREKESFWSKTFWQFFIPIAVGVIVIAIAVWLGLQ